MALWSRNRSNESKLRREVERTFTADDVARYYDDWNERYEAVFGDVYQHLQATDRTELFDHMAEVAQLADGDHVLDAGCGICGPAIEFAGRADVSIDAVTVSPQQAERARTHVAERGLSDRIRVHVQDFHRLDEVFDPDTFDCVYFLESLVHAQDPLNVLRSAMRVLRPGGRLYVKDFYRGRSDDPDQQRVIDECVAATNRICHLTIRNTEDMLRWIGEAGFDVEVSQPLAVSGYSIEAGHEFCARYDLDVAAGRDFRNTFYLDNLEIRARRPE
jgi:cyclopropane fatty-acyl-phospholipid synthase-like methyltransferase